MSITGLYTIVSNVQLLVQRGSGLICAARLD